MTPQLTTFAQNKSIIMANDNIVITIGRQFGSGGRELGRRLAEAFSFTYYDRELLSEAARRMGVSADLFASHDEKAPSFFSGLFPTSFGYGSMTGYGASGIGKSEAIYEMQADVIRAIAETESAVIVGRTADYALRNFPRCVNIFVSAPEDACVARIMERGEFSSENEARAACRKFNKLRASYYNFYTDKTWGMASSYDLCFDSSRLSFADMVDIVRLYIDRRFGNA